MTTYSCSLHFGTLDIGGIEADSEVEAREKAMERFRNALSSVDENSINVKVKENTPLPVVRSPLIDPQFFKVRKSRKAKEKTRMKVCREIVKIAEMEANL